MFTIFFVFIAVMIIIGIVKSLQNQSNYNVAKQVYLNNPEDKDAKIQLVEAESLRNGNLNTGGIDALAMMEATRDPVTINNGPLVNLTAELKALANLHANGHLTDVEFELAKAKLLNKVQIRSNVTRLDTNVHSNWVKTSYPQ